MLALGCASVSMENEPACSEDEGCPTDRRDDGICTSSRHFLVPGPVPKPQRDPESSCLLEAQEEYLIEQRRTRYRGSGSDRYRRVFSAEEETGESI